MNLTAVSAWWNNLFVAVLQRSLGALWLIPAVLVLRLTLKRTPKWVSCLLWALVAAELVCPIQISSPLSIRNVAPKSPPVEIRYTEEIKKPELFVDFSAVPGYPDNQHTRTAKQNVHTSDFYIPPLRNFWLAGAALMLAYGTFSTLRLRRRVAAALPTEANVWICDSIDTPFVLGVVRPRIYLPSALGEQERDSVLAHERAHIQRGDHWWKLLGFLILAVYWFHPLVWLSYLLLGRDIELACDEKVCRGMSMAQRKRYAQTLLSLSASRSTMMASPLGFGEIGVKERVKNVAKYKKPTVLVTVAAVVLVLFASVVFGTHQTVKSSMKPEEVIMEEIDTAGGLPDDVEEAVLEYYRAALKGPEAEAEFLYWPMEYNWMQQIYATHNGTTIAYDIKKIEKVNDNLYALTVDCTTTQDFTSETSSEYTGYVGKIDNIWRYIIHAGYVPDEISDGLTYVPGKDEFTPDEILNDRKERGQSELREMTSSVGRDTEASQLAAEFAPYGVSYDEENNHVMYDGQIVSYIERMVDTTNPLTPPEHPDEEKNADPEGTVILRFLMDEAEKETVSYDRLMVFDAKTRELLEDIPLNTIVSYANHENITLSEAIDLADMYFAEHQLNSSRDFLRSAISQDADDSYSGQGNDGRRSLWNLVFAQRDGNKDYIIHIDAGVVTECEEDGSLPGGVIAEIDNVISTPKAKEIAASYGLLPGDSWPIGYDYELEVTSLESSPDEERTLLTVYGKTEDNSFANVILDAYTGEVMAASQKQLDSNGQATWTDW